MMPKFKPNYMKSEIGKSKALSILIGCIVVEVQIVMLHFKMALMLVLGTEMSMWNLFKERSWPFIWQGSLVLPTLQQWSYQR